MLISKIETCPDCLMGKGTYWDVETQSLYYADVMDESIHRYVPASGKHYSVKLGDKTSVIIPVEGTPDQFVVSEGSNICKLTWNGVSDKVSSKELMVDLCSNNPNRQVVFNDGKVDPAGRLWMGTAGFSLLTKNIIRECGGFYSLDSKKKVLKKHIDKVTISNGLDWIGDKCYYIDSFTTGLREYRFDKDAGKITFKRSVFNFLENNLKGLYTGLAADVDGNLWLGRWDAAGIVKINPNTPEASWEAIKIPDGKHVLSLAFGGTNLDELYVTTKSFNHFTKQLVKGGLYKITGLGTRGLPMRRVRLEQ